jgi:surface protein
LKNKSIQTTTKKSRRRKKIMRLSIPLLLSVAVLAGVATATEEMASSLEEDNMLQQMHSHLRLEKDNQNGRDETSSRNLQKVILSNQQEAIVTNVPLLQANTNAIAALASVIADMEADISNNEAGIVALNTQLAGVSGLALLNADDINFIFLYLDELQDAIDALEAAVPSEDAPEDPLPPTDVFRPRNRRQLKNAVKMWINNREAAIIQYGPISEWDTALVTDMSYLFFEATTFDDDISLWNTSAVTDMSGMFSGASSFDQDLDDWDVSQVTDMSNMFQLATSFNSLLKFWNVSKVTSMARMFDNARSFNLPLSSWDVSNVTNMKFMFYSARAFSETLCWDLHEEANTNGMFCLSQSGSFHPSATCAAPGSITVTVDQRADSQYC